MYTSSSGSSYEHHHAMGTNNDIGLRRSRGEKELSTRLRVQWRITIGVTF